jgi:hypothetical protein
MADDHESWLQEQGARIVGRQPLRRYILDRMPVNYTATDMMATVNTAEDYLYHLEVPAALVKRWSKTSRQLKYLIELADRHNSSPVTEYAKGVERHHELLHENPMYREAWREFQSIRALLGEDTYWP